MSITVESAQDRLSLRGVVQQSEADLLEFTSFFPSFPLSQQEKELPSTFLLTEEKEKKLLVF